MNLPRDPQRDLERLLDDDGGELGALYRRLPRAEPPRRLDRSVLGEAARAVQGHKPRRHRWIVGFGSAAGLVLAAGVAWQVGQNALLQRSHDAFRPAPTVVPVEPITESSSLRKRERDKAAQSAAASAAPATEMEPAAAPPPPAKPAPAHRQAPKPSAAPAVAKELSPTPPAPAAAPVPQQPMPFPARVENAAPTGAAGAIAPAEQELKAKQADSSEMLDQASQLRSRAGAAPALSGSVELRRDLQLSPHDWLAHITQLLHQGRRQQAADSLRLFRRTHPDLTVPIELRALED